MTALLRIGHGNGHNRPELVDFAANTSLLPGFGSFGGNESQDLIPDLKTIEGTRLLVAGQGVGDPRARSTTLLVRDDRENRGDVRVLGSEAMPEVSEKLHPDRFIIGARYGHPLARELEAPGVAAFCAHPPPTVMRHKAGHPVVKAYAGYLEILRWEMQAAQRASYLLTLTMDGQAVARYAEPWGPRAMLAEPLNLSCRVERIDWIMFDRRLVLDGPLRKRKLYDHTGLTATLAAR